MQHIDVRTMTAKWANKVVVLDGGTGTALAKLGHEAISDDRTWCSGLVKTHPDHVFNLHKDYYLAGADIVITATYQASVQGFVNQLGVSEDEALELIRKGVHIAKNARDEAEKEAGRKRYVAASVGPYGATLCDRSEYNGNYMENMTKEDLMKWHLPRIKALTSAGPDFLAIETIPALGEALAILECLDQTQVKAYVTFTLKNEKTTAHGEDIRDAIASVVKHPNVVAVGANCFDIYLVDGFLSYVKDVPLHGKFLIVKPNGGKYKPDGWENESYKLHEKAVEWAKAGASWIGGCCATDCSDIRKVSQAFSLDKDIQRLGPDDSY